MKLSRTLDEVCYPFILETSYLCDYEVATDELATLIGMALGSLGPGLPDLAADLETVQPLAFHLNGSLRGRLAVHEDDLAWLQGRLTAYRVELGDDLPLFVLPRGSVPVPQLHLARSACKKAIRCLVRVEQEGREIPDVLPRLLNLMCNFFFVCTLVVNQRRGLREVTFVSKSYGRPSAS